MPELDDLDLDLDGDGADGDGDGGAGDDGASAAGADGTKPVVDKNDKRISDLTSKWQAAEARAKKAEQALAAGGTPASDGDPERKALLEELRETSLDAVYGEFAELKEFGIDRGLIEGQTRAEMRASATALVALVKSVATKARNAALKDHGIKAEPAGAARTPAKSYAEMSDEEFEKELARAKSGGSVFGI